MDAGDEAEVARLLDGVEAPELLRARSVRGLTPLMLAAMGRCSEALAERMLEHGPEVTLVTARSGKGRTAADYAELHNCSPGFAARLRALEKQEIARTAGSRCQTCGAPLEARPRLAVIAHLCGKGEECNPIVSGFCARSPRTVKSLLRPQFHPLSHDAKLRKKLSQVLSVIDALQGAVPDLDGWHVVDLCSGKALTSSILALEHPNVVVTAVDRMARKHQPHFEEAGLDSVKYARLNVLSDDFVDTLARKIEAEGRPTAVLGMHLCGRLSERAIEVFHSIDLVRACVLSPCCLPHMSDAPPALLPLYRSKTDDETQYAAWAGHLEGALRSSEEDVSVEAARVPDILSIKNVVMRALKPQRAVEELRSAQGAWGGAAEPLPARLYVYIFEHLSGLQLCSGEYALVDARDARGDPVWRHIRGDRWLRRGPDGLWGVCDGGGDPSWHLRHGGGGEGTLPHELVGSWERLDRYASWRKDPSMIVALAPHNRKASEAIEQQRSALAEQAAAADREAVTAR